MYLARRNCQRTVAAALFICSAMLWLFPFLAGVKVN